MKKRLESDLMRVALRILRLEGKDDVSKLHAETALLLEKLSVLKYLQESANNENLKSDNEASFFDLFDETPPVYEPETDKVVEDKLEAIVAETPVEAEPKEAIAEEPASLTQETLEYTTVDETPDTEIREDQIQPDEDAEDIAEPVMEKIKDIVAQMPHEANAVDDLFEAITPKQDYEKNDFEDITADFKETPIFEPVTNSTITSSKKSLNDRLGGGLNIGLNDKIAFIKQLFAGSNEDYDRVISQINTSSDFDEARNLIQNVVKTEYNNWEGKEVFEERFMAIIERKFN